METKKFTKEEIRELRIDSLARKYKCSNTYVRGVLKGDRKRNSELAQKIIKDATDMFVIVERETIIM
jgi:Mor family transcriptional regulator